MDTVVLEWKYSPPDYFESPIEIKESDYTMKIVDGKAEASINSAVYDANPSMSDALHHVLKAHFIGVQLVRYKGYILSSPAKTIIHPDGSRIVFLEGTISSVSSMSADVQTIRGGKVVSDSKQDRIEEQRLFTELVSKYPNDKLLASLLRSYNAAVDNPNKELVHLYDIRGALSTKFGNDTNARDTLNISRDDWSDLGRLCNPEPLRQGRHEGEHYENLRDATGAELSKVRRIAKAMIKAYLLYLEEQANPKKGVIGHD
jgi:hypothetical protein